MAPNNSGTEIIKPLKPSLVTRDYLRERSKTHNDWSAWDYIVWTNVFWFSLLSVGSVYGLYLTLTSARLYTILWGMYSGNLFESAITTEPFL